MSNKVYGHIHSIETFGAVDGPGVRFILFLQGCPLRCLYCHNPDTWNMQDGKVVSTEEIVENVLSYKNYIKSGGVTLSGGEPLIQHDFVLDLLKKLKEHNIHTAIDTSGAVPLTKCSDLIDNADMLLLDIKALDNELCTTITGQGNENALKILDYCEKTGKKIWVRHVMVPELTLDKTRLIKLANYLSSYTCIEKVELLPFHKMGEYKWEEINTDYKLRDTRQPENQEIENAKDIFRQRNLNI